MASYSKREDNSWSVRFRIISPEGKVINKRLSGFDKKAQAERAYREFMASYTAPTITNLPEDTTSLTFQQLYNMFIEYKRSRLKESSLYDCNNRCKKQILPFFKDKKVAAITKHDILTWQENLNKTTYRHVYKSDIRAYLSSIFKFGIMYCDIPINPVSQVEPFRNLDKKREMQIWSIVDFEKFIACVDNYELKVFFTVLFFSGCRKGELLALGWHDIDTQTSTINITKSITRKAVDKAYSVTSPKNATSVRKLILPTFCIDLLQRLRSAKKSELEFVFGGDKPLAENTLTRAYKKYCSLAEVEPIRLHDFRHSHASILISNGESIVLIAKRLGHANIEQTLNTYSHLMPDNELNMIEKLSTQFNYVPN